MLQPRRGSMSKISEKAKEISEEASQKYDNQKPSAPSLGRRMPIVLKTKSAKKVDNSPLPSNERVVKNSPAPKPKMKTLKGKIQMALYKAKNMKKG